MCSDLCWTFIAELLLCILRGVFRTHLTLTSQLVLPKLVCNQTGLKRRRRKRERESALSHSLPCFGLATRNLQTQERFRKTLVKTSDFHQQLSKQLINTSVNIVKTADQHFCQHLRQCKFALHWYQHWGLLYTGINIEACSTLVLHCYFQN
jgi:hypothetical protein